MKLLEANDRDVDVLCTGARLPLQGLLSWEHLMAVHVNAQDLSHAALAVCALVGAHLPNLTELYLKWVPIHPEKAYQLAGNFAGHLKQLHLCQMKLSANCINKLTHDHTLSWQMLTSLRLEETRLQEPQMKHVVPEQFPQLQVLGFFGCSLKHKAISTFTDADRSLLGIICLSGNSLAVWDIKILVQAKLPELQRLYLAKANLSSACIFHLTKGQWPLLQVLGLSTDRLNAEAMQHLEGMHLHWQGLMQLA